METFRVTRLPPFPILRKYKISFHFLTMQSIKSFGRDQIHTLTRPVNNLNKKYAKMVLWQSFTRIAVMSDGGL